MAEYAGLEIRIGGNTTKLTNALKASTKSAAELQSRIRQVTRAMQFDPTDLKNVETRIRLTGDRMQSLQSKAQLARTAMEQLGDSLTGIMDSKGELKTVRQLAGETEGLSLAAKQADERFNGLTGTLAKVYESWNRSARSDGADLLKGLKVDPKLADDLMGASTSLTSLRGELRRMQEERRSAAQDPLSLGEAIQITDADLEKVAQLKSLDFHDMFKRGLDLDDMLDDARKLGVVIEDSAIANVRELQMAFKDAQTEKRAFDDALRFEQLGTDLQRIDSEAESLSQTMRKLDDSITSTAMSDEFQSVEAKVRQVDSALENVERDLQRTGEAMKVSPDDIELAARYFQDLQQKADLSQEKVELLRQQMGMLDASGASEAAKSHQDLAKWVEESAEASRVAGKELSEQRATVANLDDQVKTLRQTIANLRGDSTIVEYSDNVIRWKRATKQLADSMDELERKVQNVAREHKALGEAQTAFDKAEREAKGYENQLAALGDEYERLSAAYGEAFAARGGIDDASGTLTDMYDKLGQLESEIQRVDAAYGGAKVNVAEFGRKLDDQRERARLAQESLEQQNGAVDDLKEAVAELAATPEVRLFERPAEEVGKLEGELRGLEGELRVAKDREEELEAAYDSSRSENELAKTAQAVRAVSQEANEAEASAKKVQEALSIKSGSILNASTVKSLGMTLSATLTPALAGIGYKMVDASSTVDSAYRDMRKTVEGTEEQFEHLKAAAIEFSRTHVTSADQILQIEAIGGELGIATENLETFAEVISNIDVATNLDVEGAAGTLGHLSNILHLTKDDYVGFGNALVRLGNNGASTETEIANIAERIGSMGSIVGMSGSDVLAWASSLASTGQNAEAAATALSKTWSFMETAVAAAGGTMDTSFESVSAAVREGGDRLTVFANLAGQTADEFADAWESDSESAFESLKKGLDDAKDGLQMIADVAHMSADEFAKAWESDPTEAAKAFITGLNDIEASGGSADKVLQSLGITAVRQKQGIEGLMQTIGGLDDNLKMSEDAWKGVSDKWGEAGDAANEAQKKAEGFSGQMQILKNIVQNFLSELGEGATPWIQRFTGFLSDLSGVLSGMSVETKSAIVAFGGLAAALGPILSMGATVATAKKEFDEWREVTVSGMSFVKAAFKSGGTEAVNALMGTMTAMDKNVLIAKEFGKSMLKGLAVGAVVAGIAAISYSLYQLYKQHKDHIAATEGLSAAISGIGTASDDAVTPIDGMRRSLDELLRESAGYEKRLADLSRTIEDSNRQYGAYAGQMDYYAGVIRELGGKADLTKEEAYRLEAALLAVNDACGTTYGLDEYGRIIDTQTGKVQDDTQAIYDNIEARKAQALVDYYSDDYKKAAEQWAAARDNVKDLADEFGRLTSDEGHAEWVENYIQKVGRADLAEQAYQNKVRDTRRELTNSREEYFRTEDALREIEGKLSDATKTQQEFADAQKEAAEAAAKAQEDYERRSQTVTDDVTGNMKRLSDAVDKAGGDDAGFNAVAKGLDAIRVSASELNGVDMSRLVSAYSDTGRSMQDVIAALEEGGVRMETWNAALEQAPGAAENMGSLTAAAFQSMCEQAGGSIEGTMTLIAGLDVVQVGDKTFYIGDNGSIIDSQGRIYDIKADLASIPDEVITSYYVNDAEAQGKALEAKRQLENIGEQSPTPEINVVDNATAKIGPIDKSLKNVANARPTPSVYLNDYASHALASIANRMSSLNNTYATVHVIQATQATGGMNGRPVIPRHATGYIATGPTLTNQGWIGEDGIEAVANWATGGAVVPLTNRKYMLPIADAIAEGMTSKLDSGTTVHIQLNYDASADANQMVRDIARGIRAANLRAGR